jgi:hypothetical protein
MTHFYASGLSSGCRKGGDSIALDNEEKELHKATLKAPLDTLVVCDYRVYHQVQEGGEARVPQGDLNWFHSAHSINQGAIGPV